MKALTLRSERLLACFCGKLLCCRGQGRQTKAGETSREEQTTAKALEPPCVLRAKSEFKELQYTKQAAERKQSQQVFRAGSRMENRERRRAEKIAGRRGERRRERRTGKKSATKIAKRRGQ